MERKLREFAAVDSGRTIVNSSLFQSPSDKADVIPYLRSYVDLGSIKPIAQRWVSSSIAKSIGPGGIIISSAGAPGVVNHVELCTAISAHFISVQIQSGEMLPDWVRHILRIKLSDLVGSSLNSDKSKLTPAEIADIFLPVPSLDVQQGDVRNLSFIESKVIQKEQAARDLRTHVASIFLDMFGSKQKPVGDGVSQFLPLSQVATIRAGRQLRKLQLSKAEDSQLVVTGLGGDFIKPKTQFANIAAFVGQDAFSLRAGDLLLARHAEDQVLALICTKEHEGAVFSDGLIRVRLISDAVDPVYLLGCILAADPIGFRQDMPVKRSKPPILISRLSNWLIRLVSKESQLHFRERFLAALGEHHEVDKELQATIWDLDQAIRAIIQRENLLAVIGSG